ncbi:valine--tRNA ligase [Candidatus Woesebacteria bacterium RIFCSPHIGHO2_01_FULL_38_10]|uniref:Valine--tRNA ligase n=1 Tax=Candidatus Woesebacteria bacterium RIFCSPLOWO2_01_FULL_39_10b TaxID=1802517 RepID=A0A1F8B8J2_9BACT|nr:MAG: valine--tRNA ligase [Candidatus Woesebacteria bacterium RIFCSPHIGHO2_01_FULL_38_10]OGM60337.1 MAG: valine--tRNA ligase [Candidatus Woesebacteria bacterium RIFCSPLOWO2_01_FULL_39_10b]
MDKFYDHQNYEKGIYKLWEKSGAFSPKKPTTHNQQPFTIIMPPPNANENLHIGHARFITVEDILTRYHRMKGNPTLWLPGADHAGIETQYVFEKKLKEKGKSRSDYDRDTLYKMIWEYVLENEKNMESQLRALGASCDWTRNKFTLDPKIVKIVYKTFKKLYDDGLVYRGERIVNYCPKCGTSFSQLEVNYLEREDNFYYLDYGTVIIATTRPETIFADTAVAVNPKDARYKNLIGKKAVLPIVGRELTIIADALVDPEFGTGALKITPGHDPTDFEIGEKHKLAKISVIDEKGEMINTPPKYIGILSEVAREEITKDLEQEKKVKKIEKIHHTVGVCYKHKTPIEPLLSKQWFIKIKPLTKLALTAINDKRVKIVTKKYEKVARNWLKNLKDWNISRQIVWGIRIPAWRCNKCFEWTITEGKQPDSCKNCGCQKLTQDPDTFDTWFSSGQWPFATLLTGSETSLKNSTPAAKGLKLAIDVPATEDFEYFYPTSVLETAYDILVFWVLRMIMLGLYATGEVPFKEILLHGLVRDQYGEKISKSKGNVIDPLIMSQKYGADAVRMSLIWGTLVENDIALSEDNIKGQRNFANKVWNVARFILQNKLEVPNVKSQPFNEDDKWIIKELKTLIKKVTRSLDKYRLNEAAEDIYNFIWNKFANNYLEKTKSRRNETQKTLEYVLRESLKLLHPFMPFVTEAIWQKDLAKDRNDLLINSSWPK